MPGQFTCETCTEAVGSTLEEWDRHAAATGHQAARFDVLRPEPDPDSKADDYDDVRDFRRSGGRWHRHSTRPVAHVHELGEDAHRHRWDTPDDEVVLDRSDEV